MNRFDGCCIDRLNRHDLLGVSCLCLTIFGGQHTFSLLLRNDSAFGWKGYMSVRILGWLMAFLLSPAIALAQKPPANAPALTLWQFDTGG